MLRFLCFFTAAWAAFGASASIDPVRYLEDVKFLSSPHLRGRPTGYTELEKAAQFNSGHLRSFG
jgi:hypothetical protein